MGGQGAGNGIRSRISFLLFFACGITILVSTFLPWIVNEFGYVGRNSFATKTGWDIIDLGPTQKGNIFGFKVINKPLASGVFSIVIGVSLMLLAVLYIYRQRKRGFWATLLLVFSLFAVFISTMDAITVAGIDLYYIKVGYGLFLFLGVAILSLVAAVFSILQGNPDASQEPGGRDFPG